MIWGLLLILFLTLIMPFLFRTVEKNLEIFLFIMGLGSVIITKSLDAGFILNILKIRNIYMITLAVFLAGLLFKIFRQKLVDLTTIMLKHIPLKVFVFFMIIMLGLLSSVITAIIAALILVEIISVLPVARGDKVKINIVSCFAIGVGAALTPLGEPLSTIVISKMNGDFWYMFNQIGLFIFVYIAAMSLLGALLTNGQVTNAGPEADENETYGQITVRALKIFLFIIALEMLGTGFKPIIDKYVIMLDSRLLYFGNMISAVLDNATLAAAEVSPKMTGIQLKAVLSGLLISGGMLIPGNIPNIISAGKLKIKSGEWAKIGVPIGIASLAVVYICLFLI